MKKILVLLLILLVGCTQYSDEDPTENFVMEASDKSSNQHKAPDQKDNGEGIFAEKGVLEKGQERVNEPKVYPEPEDGIISLSEEEWKERLTGHEYRILWKGWTERPGTGDLLHNKKEGVYVTAGCGLPVFSSETKYDSGTGWPSFYDMLNESNIILEEDYLLGYKRIEVKSACGEHLGHVFRDGPEPTGLRYCINSAALDFIEEDV